MITEVQVDEILKAQEQEVVLLWGQHAWDHANLGWFVDDVTNEYGTKVYGFGVIVTTVLPDGTFNHYMEDRR